MGKKSGFHSNGNFAKTLANQPDPRTSLLSNEIGFGGLMVQAFAGEVGHFAMTVCAYALAITAFCAFVWLVRRAGARVPIDLGDFLERLIGTDGGVPGGPLNVEFQGPDGGVIDFGHFINGTLTLCRGGPLQIVRWVLPPLPSRVDEAGRGGMCESPGRIGQGASRRQAGLGSTDPIRSKQTQHEGTPRTD